MKPASDMEGSKSSLRLKDSRTEFRDGYADAIAEMNWSFAAPIYARV